MHTANPTLELELPTRFVTREPRQAETYLGRLFRRHSLSLTDRSRKLEFLHGSASLGSELSIHRLAYGRAIDNAGAPAGDTYLAVFTLAGTRHMRVGADEIVSPAGTLCVINPHQPFSSRLSADHQQLTVCISGALLRQQLNNQGIPQRPHPLEFFPVHTDALEQAATLTNVIKTLCYELRRHSSAISRPHIARHFEQIVAELLLAEVPNNHMGASGDLANPAPAYLQGALRFIHTHLNEQISIEDIARFVSITPRALQIAFRRYLGITPRAYLRNARLDLAHHALSADVTSHLKLSSVAQDHGFANASKFAQRFRERFGQNPSRVTRRRTP
jgi:AraC-like DNA-binding protein